MREHVTLEECQRAVQRAVRRAQREHALLGRPICIWRDGHVVWLSPEETLADLRRREAEQPLLQEPLR